MKTGSVGSLVSEHTLPTIYEFPQISTPNRQTCQSETLSGGNILSVLLTTQTFGPQKWVFQEIQDQQKKCHDRVFQLMTVCDKDLGCLYVNSISKTDPPAIMTSLIKQLLTSKESKIVGQLWSGKLAIPREMEVLRRATKGSKCKTEPREESSGNNTLQMGTRTQRRTLTQLKKLHSLFRLGAAQTQMAQAFVRQNRLEYQRSHQRLQRLRQEGELATKAELMEFEESTRKQYGVKHEELLKNISDRILARDRCKRKKAQREREFGKFIKVYRQSRPLFRRNLDRMAEAQAHQKSRVSSRLKEIRSQVRPVGGQELNSFERSYLLKRQEARRSRDSDLEEQRVQLELSNKHYYRGRFHDIIRTQPNESVLSGRKFQRENNKRVKRLQYSEEIKTKIKVEIDPKKREQMSQSLHHRLSRDPRQVRPGSNPNCQSVLSQPDNSSSPDSRADGLRFLKYARQRRNKAVEMKQPYKIQESQTLHNVTRPISTRTQNQLHDLWIKRFHDSNESPQSKKRLLMTRMEALQTKAGRAQQLNRIKSEGGRFPQSPKCDADEFLVNSIKTKLEFLGM